MIQITKFLSITFLTLTANIFILNSAIASDEIKKDDPNKYNIVNFVYENDLFVDKDEGYTDGLRFAWLSSENATPKLIKSLASKLPGVSEGKKHVAIAVGQEMFTPRDLTQTALIPDDQPYAGWLYTSLGVISDNHETLNSAMLTLGVVGPLSMAEKTQTEVHKIKGVQKPLGWDNQLHNEPGVNFSYERKWKNLASFKLDGFGVDFTPDAGFSLGNINTSTSVGGALRIGYDLPDDYGPPRIRPSLPGADFFVPRNVFGYYFFASTHTQLVLRNIFLDGNTFRNSHSVDKEILTADVQLGIAVNYKNLRISYSHIFMTKEFKGQRTAPEFGSISASYRF